MPTNKDVFSTHEFDSFAFRRGLTREEKFLIGTYLAKEKTTLEGGTGGGNILLEMLQMGYRALHGFDFLPEFIDVAKRRDITASISFTVQDAVRLDYEDESFDQLIYLQQLLSFIESEPCRREALQEAHRVLRAGGTALFSFLSFDVRTKSTFYLPYLIYLKLLRRVLGSHRSEQSLPWLKLRNKINSRALLDLPPHVYWYRLDEVHHLLTAAGFRIAAIGSTHQIHQGKLLDSTTALSKEPLKGMLYVVARK